MVWWQSRKDQTYRQSAEQATTVDSFDLEYPLLQLSQYPQDVYQLRDACEGVHIFGGSGSGKTSGSGKAFAKSFLASGYGGLVLCVKADERALWEQYAQETNRQRDVMIVDDTCQHCFNFLDYEYHYSGKDPRLVDNLVTLFRTVLEFARQEKGGGGSNEAYWEDAVDQLLHNAIVVLLAAKDQISLLDIHKLVASAPKNLNQVEQEDDKGKSFFRQSLEKAVEKLGTDDRELDLAAQYWLEEFPSLSERTRSSIVSIFTGMANKLMRGMMGKLFCTETNIGPEFTFAGRIIIVDLPVLKYGHTGVVAQGIFKYLWQKAVTSRPIDENTSPVFLWVDESKRLVNAYDHEFLGVARSSRACTVFLTQDISGYYAVLGSSGQAAADTLLANFQTKIFHANTDHKTNQWASEQIARSFQERVTINFSLKQKAEEQDNFGQSVGEQLDYNVQPETFQSLRRGGAENDLIVEGILVKAGRQWQANKGKSFLQIEFSQDF